MVNREFHIDDDTSVLFFYKISFLDPTIFPYENVCFVMR